MPYIQKYFQANHSSSDLYRTYSGISSDKFTVKQDSEPYCIEASLAGQTAYTAGRFPNSQRNKPYWFTKEKIVAPYKATLANFQTFIVDNTWWRVESNNVGSDFNANSLRNEVEWVKSLGTNAYPTATGPLCYSLMDGNNGEDGYNSSATRPIRAVPFLPDSSYSYSPTLAIERVYSRSNFYRLRVYKNGNLIDTIVTIGCFDTTKPYKGHNIKPDFIFQGFSADQCPPGTCEVDCGSYVCCYGSDGISVFNYTK